MTGFFHFSLLERKLVDFYKLAVTNKHFHDVFPSANVCKVHSEQASECRYTIRDKGQMNHATTNVK
jgi:hypothetical protein